MTEERRIPQPEKIGDRKRSQRTELRESPKSGRKAVQRADPRSGLKGAPREDRRSGRRAGQKRRQLRSHLLRFKKRRR